jgi:nitrogen fixation protein FixH
MAEQNKGLDDIERVIRLVEIALTIGRHILHIMWLFFGISVAVAVYDFATGNIAWGIISSLFALGGFIFMMQIYQHRSRHRARRQARLAETRPEYKEVASA